MSWGISIIDIMANYNFPCTVLPDNYFVKKKIKKAKKHVEEISDEKFFSRLKSKYAKNDERIIYKKKVWAETEKIAYLIKGIETRGFKRNHIDHIVPIYLGFKYKIPIRLIASLSNLEMIPYKDNMEKCYRLSQKALLLLKKWGYEISKHQVSETKPYQNSKSVRVQKCEQLPLFISTQENNEGIR